MKGVNEMKKLNILLAAFSLYAVTFLFSTKAFSYPIDLTTPESVFDLMAAEEDSVITFDTIKNELSSDGEWIKVNPGEIDSESVTDGSQEIDEGLNTEYVWRPYGMDENWNPYTNGHWIYTSCGWMWISYYSWGWRPYHYGRWWWSPVWGWVWSPGYIWGPSWVVWMNYGDYCGWYPLSPRVRWHHHHWHHGYYCGHLRYRVRHWTFVERRNFTSINITKTVIVEPEKNTNILQKADFTSAIDYNNGKVENKGPDVTQIENSTGEKIAPKNVDKYNSTKAVDEYTGKITEIEKKQDEQNVQRKRESSFGNNSDKTKDGKNNNRGTYKNDNTTTRAPENHNSNRNNEPKSNNEGKKNDGNNNNQGRNNDNNNNTKTEKRNDSQNMYKAPEKKNDNYKAPEQKYEYKAPEHKNEYKAPEKKNDTYKAPEQKNDSQNMNKGNNEQRNDNNGKQKGNSKQGNDNSSRQDAD